jgi:putative transposase
MEVDEEWHADRKYMKMTIEDQNQENDDHLLCEIKQMKEGINTQEKLVAT